MSAFALLMALAGLNKWRHAPAAAHDSKRGCQFRRTLALEYALIASMLLVTALLTTHLQAPSSGCTDWGKLRTRAPGASSIPSQGGRSANARRLVFLKTGLLHRELPAPDGDDSESTQPR